MIVVILSTKENIKDIIDLIFLGNRDRYVKFGFKHVENCLKETLQNIRISSSHKYTPFIKIASVIEQSNKIVLVNDVISGHKLAFLRKHKNVKFVNIGSPFLYESTDMYVEKMPKTIKEMAAFLDIFEAFLEKNKDT